MVRKLAPVAKWLTLRSAKPVLAGSIPARRSNFNACEVLMSDSGKRSTRLISLDSYAVALAIALAVLVRFNWIPPIKW